CGCSRRNRRGSRKGTDFQRDCLPQRFPEIRECQVGQRAVCAEREAGNRGQRTEQESGCRSEAAIVDGEFGWPLDFYGFLRTFARRIMSKRVAFYTLGCKLNFSETSAIGRIFQDAGYTPTPFHTPADIYVINTCSVTENADRKCRKVVREALSHSPGAYIVVVGCYAQLKPREITEIPGVDMVLGAAEKFNIIEHINELTKPAKPIIHNAPVAETNVFIPASAMVDRTRTFLKVQDGCDYSCTFCTIPLARGASRSGTVADIVKQAAEIGASGIKEIVLTGVNIGDFGIRGGERTDRFIDLVRALDEVESVSRFRISSIEPNLLTDEIIAFVAQSKRFVPHFHVPLQS